MLPKAHLTSHSRMSGSRWVITPPWLSEPSRSFLYSSSVYSWHLFFNSVTQSCLTLCDSMDCSRPGFPINHQLPELAKLHDHWVSDAIQISHPLSSPYPPDFNLSQHRGLFQWVSSSHHMAKVLKFELQHQSFQWIYRTDFLLDGPVCSFGRTLLAFDLLRFVLQGQIDIYWLPTFAFQFLIMKRTFFGGY